MLNDRVIPFFDEQEIPLMRILTDRGTEYCGTLENHAYELFLSIVRSRSQQNQGRHATDKWHLRKIP
jgi:hypothetical protein